MKPGGGGAPVGDLASRINRDFGSVEKLKELFQTNSRRPIRQRLGVAGRRQA